MFTAQGRLSVIQHTTGLSSATPDASGSESLHLDLLRCGAEHWPLETDMKPQTDMKPETVTWFYLLVWV